MDKKDELRGISRIDRAVQRQLRGDSTRTDPNSKRNRQLEAQLRNQFGYPVTRTTR